MLSDLNFAEMGEYVTKIGLPKFRAEQIFNASTAEKIWMRFQICLKRLRKLLP